VKLRQHAAAVDLSQDLGVSQMTVIRAVDMLKDEGLVYSIKGRHVRHRALIRPNLWRGTATVWPVSEFYIDPDLLRHLNSQVEPTIRAIEAAEPYARVTDIASVIAAPPPYSRVAELARTLGPSLLAASGVAKVAEQFAAQLAEANLLPDLNALVRALAFSQADHAVASFAAVAAAAVGTSTLPKPTVTATGKAAEPTLLTQFASLPCGQRFAVILIGLCVILTLDLPPHVRDYIAYLIGLFSAALWCVSKVTKR